MSKQFTINITDDSIVGCSESLSVSIVSVIGNTVIIGNVNKSEVVIMDNDSKLP